MLNSKALCIALLFAIDQGKTAISNSIQSTLPQDGQAKPALKRLQMSQISWVSRPSSGYQSSCS